MTKRWSPPAASLRVSYVRHLLKLDIDARKRRLAYLSLQWPHMYAELMSHHRVRLGFPRGLEGECPSTEPQTLINIMFGFLLCCLML
jgi:hypothetical protein